ncbi:hypothetical protein AV530_019621 [Patagioenas fasciata monilis]|uniref:Uncharacterized protein n=1 Tax=Patagioenas fasciata monilis TaxID=372326 RepID=A0A1V4JDV3_PATFA|nr:hypothetical protein AV530_019621 [Patagioenas fasciata monilis]
MDSWLFSCGHQCNQGTHRSDRLTIWTASKDEVTVTVNGLMYLPWNGTWLSENLPPGRSWERYAVRLD